MDSCPVCGAELPETALRCKRCEGGRRDAFPEAPLGSGDVAEGLEAGFDPQRLEALLDELLEAAPHPTPEDVAPEALPCAEPEPPLVRRRLPDELARQLTDFTLRLARALTKSSYYTAEHQEAENAKAGLYASFLELVADRPEVTFYAHASGEKRSMLVYGIFDEPTELAQAMVKGMAEIYIPKLSHFFESNGVLSVSFKRGLAEAEFHGFVDLLASPHGAASGPGPMAEQLVEAGIRNISLVAQEDRLAGRRLSWRVEMALTRLRKDLSLIPLFRDLDAEELRRVRLQVFRDVLRPLRQQGLIRELLENCDVIADQVSEFSRDQLGEIEVQVLQSIPEGTLPGLLEGLAKDIVAARRNDDERMEELLRLTRRVAERLRGEHARELEDTFRHLLASHVLSLDELPAFLREQLTVERQVDTFLAVKDALLDRISAAASAAEYERYLHFFERIFPELIRRPDLSPAIELVERISAQRSAGGPFAERSQLASAWLEERVHSALSAELVQQLADAEKVRRDALADLARRLGDGIVPHLLDALRQVPSAPARQALGDLLVEFKQPALGALGRELDREESSAAYLVELLRILSRMGDPGCTARVLPFLDHATPEVRAEALRAVCTLDASSGEARAVRALADAEPTVRETALRWLFQQRSAAPELFAFCERILARLDAADEQIAGWICAELGHYDQPPGRERSVALLLRVAGEGLDEGSGWWSSLKSSVAGEPAHVGVKIEACRALAHLRATEAADLLRQLAQSRVRPLQQAARHALRRIGV